MRLESQNNPAKSIGIPYIRQQQVYMINVIYLIEEELQVLEKGAGVMLDKDCEIDTMFTTCKESLPILFTIQRISFEGIMSTIRRTKRYLA